MKKKIENNGRRSGGKSSPWALVRRVKKVWSGTVINIYQYKIKANLANLVEIIIIGCHYWSLLNTCKGTCGSRGGYGFHPHFFLNIMFSKLFWFWKKLDCPPIPSVEKKYKHFPLEYNGPLQPKIQFKVVKNA